LSEYGYTHFALDVENIQQAFDYLEDAGVNWHHNPVDTGDGYWMAYGRDPFGNVIEIQQLADGSAYSLNQLNGVML
jgi:predicted enzyme related to lactoylglutathione lyase